MNLIRPPSGYVTWRCDLTFWPWSHVKWWHLGVQSLYQILTGYVDNMSSRVTVQSSCRTCTYTVGITGGRPSTSVNGDIAVQWEWSNFDPSQNPNPLTDYDKTLHNWLRPRDEHVTQNLCQSAVRVRLRKYVKYNTNFFIFFFRTRLLKQPVHGISREMSQNTHCDVRSCLFGVHTMADNIFGFKFPKIRQKWPSISTFERPRTDSRRMTS